MKGKTEVELKEELASFQSLWKGGFDSKGKSLEFWGSVSSEFDKIVDICISPYINKEVVALEIGCGGGKWTKKLLGAEKIYCLDALSAEHNRFWERFSRDENIYYFKVEEFKCSMLLENSIDYVFSYDTFCHISYSGAFEYLKHLYSKLKKGANCFIMIADACKYVDRKGRKKLVKDAGFSCFEDLVEDYDGKPYPGRWYFYGTERFCEILEKCEYIIANKDVVLEIDERSPIIHFRK